jgi:hypothetical protein
MQMLTILVGNDSEIDQLLDRIVRAGGFKMLNDAWMGLA